MAADSSFYEFVSPHDYAKYCQNTTVLTMPRSGLFNTLDVGHSQPSPYASPVPMCARVNPPKDCQQAKRSFRTFFRRPDNQQYEIQEEK